MRLGAVRIIDNPTRVIKVSRVLCTTGRVGVIDCEVNQTRGTRTMYHLPRLCGWTEPCCSHRTPDAAADLCAWRSHAKLGAWRSQTHKVRVNCIQTLGDVATTMRCDATCTSSGIIIIIIINCSALRRALTSYAYNLITIYKYKFAHARRRFGLGDDLRDWAANALRRLGDCWTSRTRLHNLWS